MYTRNDDKLIGTEVVGTAADGLSEDVRFANRDKSNRNRGAEEEILHVLADMSERLGRIEARLGADSQPEERWWTPDEVAKKVERAPLTVREWARLKKIPSRKDGRGRRWISDPVAKMIFRYQGLPPEEDLSLLAKA